MWGLEYALVFGVPNNKLELIEGESRCAFPFRQRDLAEAHFASWIETLCRWKGIADRPSVRKTAKRWIFEAGGFRLELAPRPIELYIPFKGEQYRAFSRLGWRRDCWPGQPEGYERGWEWSQDHWDIQHHLWSLFGEWCERHGGAHSGLVDLLLTETTAVAPDQYYFRKSKKECLVADQYFEGVPELIAEVLSPTSRSIDRGPRKQLYRQARVPWLWLLDPDLEVLEVYQLAEDDYCLVGTYHPGDSFTMPLFPGEQIAVEPLFETQDKRWREHNAQLEEPKKEPEPMPEWLAPPEKRLGLEYLFLLGHHERRFELWNNRAPCVLPFGSVAEARHRLHHFIEEACRWEQLPVGVPTELDADVEQAEVGRFRFTRRGRHVHLDVAIDGRKFQQLLEVCADRDTWDWGERPRKPRGEGQAHEGKSKD